MWSSPKPNTWKTQKSVQTDKLTYQKIDKATVSVDKATVSMALSTEKTAQAIFRMGSDI